VGTSGHHSSALIEFTKKKNSKIQNRAIFANYPLIREDQGGKLRGQKDVCVHLPLIFE